MQRKAKFSIGDVVHHRLFLYRGIIFDVDIEFSETEDWYENVATTRPAKDQPWYHIIVDGENHETYVAESNLVADDNHDPVQHPALRSLFSETEQGYKLRSPLN